MQAYNRKLKSTNRVRCASNKVRDNNKAYQRKWRKWVRQEAKRDIRQQVDEYYNN